MEFQVNHTNRLILKPETQAEERQVKWLDELLKRRGCEYELTTGTWGQDPILAIPLLEKKDAR